MRKVITLIVKGNEFKAARAAADRGIPFVFERYLPASRETVGRTMIEFLDKVSTWYHDDPRPFGESGAGFPDGTLLLWTDGRGAQEPKG